jgi:outer membrane protein assembly factor BamA
VLPIDSIRKGQLFNKVIIPDSINLSFTQRRAITKQVSDTAYNRAVLLLLKYVEEGGYPFAKVEPLIVENDKTYDLLLKVTKGPVFIWDTLTLPPELPVKGKFLEKYLYLKRGEIYDPKQALRIGTVLKTMPYLQLQAPLVFGFSGNKASPQLALKHRKVNMANGVLGFLPNESQQGKLILNGEINLKLMNLFKTGKLLDLQWRSTRPGSLKLLVEYIHPVFLGSHFELQTNIQLLKEDSSFFNRALKGALLYQFENATKAGFYVRDSRSAVLLQNNGKSTSDTAQLRGTKFLEAGITAEISTLSDYFLPRKGIYLKSEFGFGQKQVIVPKLDSTSQNENTENPQVSLKLVQYSYLPISTKSVALLKLQAAMLWNNNLQRNELLRIGGLQSFRGFAENYFFASSYAVATTEWFYYFEESSSISLFVDQGAVNRSLLRNNISDYPTAVGIAIKFGTRNGVFNLAYAMGRDYANPFSIQTAVVHFGISGVF